MRKVVLLAVLFAAVSMLFLNAAAEIGIIESPNIDIIQMETEQLDEEWLYKHVEASPEDTYKELMKAIYIISSMQYGPYSNYEDVPSHDLSMDAITEWLDAFSSSMSWKIPSSAHACDFRSRCSSISIWRKER